MPKTYWNIIKELELTPSNPYTGKSGDLVTDGSKTWEFKFDGWHMWLENVADATNYIAPAHLSRVCPTKLIKVTKSD